MSTSLLSFVLLCMVFIHSAVTAQDLDSPNDKDLDKNQDKKEYFNDPYKREYFNDPYKREYFNNDPYKREYFNNDPYKREYRGPCCSGWELDGALCYPQCAGGFTGIGPVCWRGFDSYRRGAGAIPWSSC